MKKVFICGSALRGQPDHKNLQSAIFLREAKTKPLYKMHSAHNGWHPAIYQVANEEEGFAIPGELYELTESQYDHLVSTEPPDMYPDLVALEDGETAVAILYPRELVEKFNWADISPLGGWVAYKQTSISKSGGDTREIKT